MTDTPSPGRTVAHHIHHNRAGLAMAWCAISAITVSLWGAEPITPLLSWGAVLTAVWSALLSPLLWTHHDVSQCPPCVARMQSCAPPENIRMLREWHRSEANTTISRLRSLGLFIMVMVIAVAVGMPQDPAAWAMVAVGVCALPKIDLQEYHAAMRSWCPLCAPEARTRENAD